MSNNVDINEELYDKAIIKANKRTFNFIAAANNYIKTFIFREDCFLIQFKTIENYKIKIAKKSTTYAKLATKFFKNRS